MSTNTIDAALDFMPAEKGTRRPRGGMGSLRAFFAALRNGIAAAHQYERLTLQGLAPEKAIKIVFRDHFADQR